MVQDAEEWIDLVIKRASELRAAGVASIGFDGMTAEIAAVAPQPSDDKPLPKTDEDPYLDPLDDPDSDRGGVVPGFAIEKFPVFEE